MDSTLRINLPADFQFSCHNCGKCCSNSWRVGVSESEAKRITALEAYQARERAGYMPLRTVDGRMEMTLTDDGSCPFLRDAGCDIHRETGPEIKPLTCRLFPFGLVNTPDGFFVSLSFSCPSVLKGVGVAVSEHRQDLENIVSDHPNLNTACLSEIKLTGSRTVGWSEYSALEEQLIQRDHWPDPVSQLTALACWLGKHSQEPEIPTKLPDSFLNSLIYREAMEVLPVFAANIIAIFEFPEECEERTMLVQSLLSTGGSPSNQIEGAVLPAFFPAPVPSPLVAQTLDRYLRGQIFGKRLLVGTSVLARVLLLATAVSIVLYYLQVRAQLPDGQDELKSMEWAFELVESCFVTHASDFEPLFEAYENAVMAYASIDPE